MWKTGFSRELRWQTKCASLNEAIGPDCMSTTSIFPRTSLADEVVSVQRSNEVGVQVQDQIIPRTSLADEVDIVERSDQGSTKFKSQIFPEGFVGKRSQLRST